jgi:hypothetical protein
MTLICTVPSEAIRHYDTITLRTAAGQRRRDAITQTYPDY